MKSFWSIYSDTIIGIILSLFIVFIGNTFEFDSKVIDILINSLPLIIMTFVVAINKPKSLVKFIRIINRKKFIYVKYSIAFNDVNISSDNYRKFINIFMNKFKDNSGKKIRSESIGDYLCKSTLEMGYLGDINIQYNISECSLLISLRLPSKYINIKNVVQKVSIKLSEAIANMNSGYVSVESQLEIQFIDEKNEENKITNPIVERLFKGFDIKSFQFKYEGDHNSKISFYNDRIVFYNNDYANLIKDLKNELMLT